MLLLLSLAAQVTALPATVKVRPADPLEGAPQIAIAAARNEFEAFQVVIAGPATNVRMTAQLDLPVTLYREALLSVATPSNAAGATGAWPDALVPDRDEVYGETRNAFPFDVPAGETRTVWVETFVPESQAAGMHHGSVHVTADGLATDVPFDLEVWDFTLPATASLKSAFHMGWADACIAHYGAPCDEAGTIASHQLYATFALDHRISLADIVVDGPTVSGDWSDFDAAYAPWFDGTAPTRLVGARLSTIQYGWTADASHYAEWAQHFRARGWFDRTFDYTCDEPPKGCSWSDIPARAAVVHAGDPEMRTMVTTTLADATQNGVAGAIDVLSPIVDAVESPQRAVWWYLSCEPASSCSNGTVGGRTGWPNYIVDAPAIENRIMGWLAFGYGVDTELYYDTTAAYQNGDPWHNLYAWGNNGDGTLFYPGKPSIIGGTKDIPVASIRLKMIREGREDYEYLRMLADAGDPQLAAQLAARVAPQSSDFTHDPRVLEQARYDAAARILALTGGQAPATGSQTLGGVGSPPVTSPTKAVVGGCSAAGGAPAPTAALILAIAALVRLLRRRKR